MVGLGIGAICGGLGGAVSIGPQQMGAHRQAPLEQSKRQEQCEESAGVVVSAISAPMLQAAMRCRKVPIIWFLVRI